METQTASKSILQSKTFWVNVLSIILAILGISRPDILHINADTLLWISGVVNILLRFVSSGSVSLAGTDAQVKK